MTKGTPSMGRKNKISHIRCRRCGRVSYKIQVGKCAACGYGKTAKIRKYAWQTKTPNRQFRMY